MHTLDFFNHVPENIIIVTPDMHVLAATETYLETTGRRREDILGKHFLLEAFPNSEVPYEENPVKLSIDKAIETRQVDYLDVIRYDIAKPAEEGGGYSERYWEASHTPVLDEAGQIRYIIQNTHDVTEREKARREQAMTEEKFRFLTDAVPQLIFTMDVEGKLTYMNKRWADYTGIPVEDTLQGNGWEQAIHPDDLQLVRKRMNEVLPRGEEFQLELRIRNKYGMYRWFLTKSLPMKDENGNTLLWVGSSSDVQDAKQLVQELLESNEQMSELADQVQKAYTKAEVERRTLERLIMKAPVFFCILRGPEHRYELINEKYKQLLPQKELLGKAVEEVLPELREQGFIHILDEVYSTGKEYVAEGISVNLDRYNTGELEEMHLTFIYQAIYDEQHQINGIMVCGYDVTEQAGEKRD
ncbi:PAS domain-containing protein [Pontibacter anaerobius]|uniref:histidine kinase n=1 Tax=Pontibacter anaerobius TaxID=2993940 RepID=A0ABT3RJN5_9BACT|nr:PAS domain-containing protein [Pontibacter anaerobius]MCX2742073.1 PAS domain-containing protein [Pontibacter anaerobius]